jgi:tyrosyl-tRNA synthetase
MKKESSKAEKIDRKQIEALFARGTVVEVLPTRDALIDFLLSGKKMRIYIGVDPTGPSLHLGHAKNLIFLEELRQLGHEVILLIGDFTARIGDPTDKSATRKQLSAEDVKKNVAGWLKQTKPIMNFDDKTNPAKVMYNSTWLSKLSFADVVELASNFTVQQMLERDMFAKRLKEQSPIHIHEFMYPLMQGYDSVAMDVDAELCGTDQIFNALAGRTLLKRLEDKEKLVIVLNLVANPKTGELMSKSNGTGVFLDLSPNDLYGAIMALPDPMLEPLFVNCTRIPLDQKEILMSSGPRNAKAKIAFDIVRRFHGEVLARSAEEAFEKTFAKGGVPDDVSEIKIDGSTLVDVLIKAKVVPSKTEWRRLVGDGAVSIIGDAKQGGVGEKVSDVNFAPTETTILKIGKRRFVKVVI